MMEFTTSLVLMAADNWLRWLQVPHLRQDSAIEVVGQTLSVQISWLSPLGPLFFLLAAGVYSLLRKRPLAVFLANLLSAFCWWFVLRVALVTSQAWLQHHGYNISASLIVAVCVCVALALFLSAERGIRGMLAPVTENSNATRQANPLIVGWNQIIAKS